MCRRSHSTSSRQTSEVALSDRKAVREISDGIGLALWKAETDRLAGVVPEPYNRRGAQTWISLGSGVSARSMGSSGSRRQTCPVFVVKQG